MPRALNSVRFGMRTAHKANVEKNRAKRNSAKMDYCCPFPILFHKIHSDKGVYRHVT